MKKPLQYIPVGYPFSGKTTVSIALEKQFGFRRVNIDGVKAEFGFKDISDDDVSDADWQNIFQEIDRRVRKHLQEGRSVINETAWVTKEWRERARKVASDVGIETVVLFVNVPEDVARQRWIINKETKERFDLPDNVFEAALKEFEPPTTDEHVIEYRFDVPLNEWIQTYFS